MTRNVVSITPESNLQQAYAVMRSLGARHLPVVRNERVIGIVSDRDILPYTRNGQVSENLLVEQVMTESPIVAAPQTTIARIAELMLEYKIDALPVVRGDQLVGLVTSSDLLVLLLTPPESLSELPFEFNLFSAEAWNASRAAAAG